MVQSDIDKENKMKLIILLLFSSFKTFGKPFEPCLMGSSEKCMAISSDMTEYSIPNVNAGLVYAHIQPNYTVCFNLCSETKNCFMAAYRFDNKTCLMYENIDYVNVIDSTYLLYFWRCCNTNRSNPVLNRCPGFWKYKLNYASYNSLRINDSLISISNVELFTCQIRCLENPICGSINIQTFQNSAMIFCELIIQFPVENMKMKPNSGSVTYLWQCASNYTLPIPNTECVPRFKDGTGYWVIQNTSIPMYHKLKTVMYFHTFNYQACLDNCMVYRHCKRAWYSLESLFCMLESDELSTCADTQAANNYNFTTYIWKHCSSEIDSQHHLNIQQKTCRKIKTNQNMYILSTKCGHLPSNTKHMFLCSTPTTRGTSPSYSENFHCQNNQSFQVIGKLEEQIPELGEYANLTWMQVITGYESFWFANVSDVNFPQVDKSECDVYNTDMNVVDENDLKIIQRKQWFAKKPKGAENPYPKFPVPFVIITDTERPYCDCFTEEACSYQMRVIQDSLVGYVFIPYNFIVTGDGMVYIGKGWEFENKATGGAYNSISVSIALCGRYILEPEIESLNSVKKIIKLGIREKKISENYTLYLLRDIGLHNKPLEGLSAVIELWPRYRGYLKYDCPTIQWMVILTNVMVSLLVILLSGLFVHMFIRRIQHSEQCKSARICRVECIYGELSKKPIEIFPRIFLYPINSLTKENILVSPITTSVFWIENKLEVGDKSYTENPCQCQVAVFSIFNLCRFQSDLVNMSSVVIMPELRSCSKFIAFFFERYSELENQSLLVLHCSSADYFKQFVNQLYQNQCLCQSFNLHKYVPDSGALVLAYELYDDTEYSKALNGFNRVETEDRYSFLYDENNCLNFYRQNVFP